MARYHITALNQINVGAKRTFFNFDSTLAYDLNIPAYLLSTESGSGNESPQGNIGTEHTGEHKDKIIRFYTSQNTDEFQQKIQKFNENKDSLGNMYISEYGFVESQKKNLFQVSSDIGQDSFIPMYDIMDVSIKSATNGFVPVNTKIDSEDDFQNVFAPDLNNKPLGFCQINNGKLVYTYMITDRTDKDPYMYSSQLKTQRLTNTRMSYYEIILESEPTNTLTYKTPGELSNTSYAEFIKNNGDVLSVFEPARNFRGIDRNYILNFPDSEIDSEYDTGNVHAEIIPGKNPLNATYSMEMSSATTIQNARRYCGISRCGNRPYLKFYDSVDYDCTNTGNGSDSINYQSTRKERDKLPYQKIEFFNKNVFTNKRKHKSNLFSVKIEDLDDLSQNAVQDDDTSTNSASSEHAVRRIREDLYSAVQKIVENVCPVNTQLFKVYFGNG